MAEPDPPSCPQCRAELALVVEYPDRTAGCVTSLAGCLLAPVLLGIPLLLYGAHLAERKVRHWHCRGCGRTFPA